MSILDKLVFGKDSNKFEEGLSELGEFLGYESQRPEKDFKNGLPDVLWRMTNGEFLIIEAKNEVKNERKEIYKEEAEQITNSYNWFKDNYVNKKGYPLLVHPSITTEFSAYPDKEVRVITQNKLQLLKDNTLHFTRELSECFNYIDEKELKSKLLFYKLLPSDFISNYTEKIR